VARACTIGTFDGVHVGHQALIRACAELGDVLVVTFNPHPKKVLGLQAPLPLQTLQERIDSLEKAGAHAVEVLEFHDALARQSYQEFLKFLIEKERFEHLVLGEGATLGRGREGDIAAILEYARTLGIDTRIVQPVLRDGDRVSSSLIRQLVQEGDLRRAAELLGRPFAVTGLVQSGAGRGNALGFPTANLSVHGRVVPPRGVYAGYAKYDREWLPALLNLGPAPTFGRAEDLLEVHILDGKHHLTGRQLEVMPAEFLRAQQAFGSVEELQNQLLRDQEKAHSSLRAGIQGLEPS
jgi:riboflavin kinase/FMN adenylyltransferase